MHKDTQIQFQLLIKKRYAHTFKALKLLQVCCLFLSFQGEEGPRGPPGEPGDKGDKVGDSHSVFPGSLLSRQWCLCNKKKNLFQNLNGDSDTYVHRDSAEADLFIFCRAAKVSRAHRVQLAKRERM